MPESFLLFMRLQTPLQQMVAISDKITQAWSRKTKVQYPTLTCFSPSQDMDRFKAALEQTFPWYLALELCTKFLTDNFLRGTSIQSLSKPCRFTAQKEIVSSL